MTRARAFRTFALLPEPVTEKERSMRNTLRILFVVLSLSLLLPLAAQERVDTVYTFRFVPGQDMFYVPWKENAAELARLEQCVRQWKAEILAKRMPLRVDGYSASGGSEAANLALAKTRSNRVKSELITRQQLAEECFVTRNHSGGGDYVTVRIAVPSAPSREEEVAPETGRVCEGKLPDAATDPAEEKPAEEVQAQPAQKEPAATTETLSLRANLLRWATLTPDLGLEWRVCPSWGILVNGSWTSWSWKSGGRRYALWEVMPEVRYYMGGEKRGYLGAMYKAGQFNHKLSGTGRQGDLAGGGITGGYRLRLNDALSLDFTLAVGCLHADYEKYETVGGVRVRRGDGARNWWGPVHAGIVLVWDL